jgi:hypothetical protein
MEAACANTRSWRRLEFITEGFIQCGDQFGQQNSSYGLIKLMGEWINFAQIRLYDSRILLLNYGIAD